MGKTPVKCYKGDMLSRPPLEICVERSSPNEDRITIVLWKRYDDTFAVDKKQVGQNKWKPIIGYKTYNPETKAWLEYEKACDEYGCSPYPEAEKYYKRKGLLK
ncbi:MAG: hypothetical protein HYX79_00080 [Chloroflexi bacterium]|nr:hypothetical protein [Chloroflexota bacterium]